MNALSVAGWMIGYNQTQKHTERISEKEMIESRVQGRSEGERHVERLF